MARGLVLPGRRHPRSLRARPADARPRLLRRLRRALSGAMLRLALVELALIAAHLASAAARASRTVIVAALAARCSRSALVVRYARVRLVVEDRRSAIGALLAGGRFVAAQSAARSPSTLCSSPLLGGHARLCGALGRAMELASLRRRGRTDSSRCCCFLVARVVGGGDRRSSSRGWRTRRILRRRRSTGRSRRPRKRSPTWRQRRRHDVPRLPERAHPHRRRRGREHRDPAAHPDARRLHAASRPPPTRARRARSTSSTGPT